MLRNLQILSFGKVGHCLFWPQAEFPVWRGSCVWWGTTDWHGMQPAIMVSTCLSMPGNQTFSLISFFVLTSPWWPLCASDMACRERGITIFVPRSTVSSVAVTVSSSLILWNYFSAAISTPSAKSCVSDSDPHELPFMSWISSRLEGKRRCR